MRLLSGSASYGSAIDGLAAFGLVIVFGFAFEWLFIAMGLFAGNAQAAQGLGIFVFPFAFARAPMYLQLDAQLAEVFAGTSR